MPLAVVLFLLGLMSGFAWAEEDPKYILTAVRRTAPLVIDGHLEPAWLAGAKADSFVQREPDYPAAETQRNEVYVLYDRDALYFGYMLYDTAPDSIRGQIQRRDNDSNSDFIDLYLDTFHDHRNGYWFTVTAAGVQAEGTFFIETDLSNSWDAVWESAVAKTDSGWSCELRIPFQIMRHGGEREDGWGIAFARKLYRRNEANFWPPVDPEVGWRASKIGTLLGLKDIAPSAHVELLPHVVGRWDAPLSPLDSLPQDFRSNNEWENLGLTLKYVPSATLSVDAAYQPDFAQVDVDQATINLSDYPVFLSEKRPFFLENKEYFEETPYTFIYSRRVTDPDYGARVNAQQGRFKMSAFGGKNRLQYLNDNLESAVKLQDAAFGRASVDFRNRHRIGVSWTYLNQAGYSAATAGMDARFRFRERDRLGLWFAGVERQGTPEQHWYRVAEVHDEQPVEARASYNRDWGPFRSDIAAAYRGIDFDNNDLGWSDVSNVFRQSLWIGDNYYLDGTFIRNIGFDINSYHATLANGDHSEGYANIDFFGTTRGNWNFGGGTEHGDFFRRAPMGPTDGEHRDNFGTFNLEYYRSFWNWAWLWSDFTKPFRYGAEARYRTYRDGELFNLVPEVTWLPRSNIEMRLSSEWNRVWHARRFADQQTDYRNWFFKTSWSPTLDLSLRGTLQWIEKSDDPDERGHFFANLLLAYNWNPGSWFYLVYDEAGRDIDRPDHLNRSVPGDRTLRAKFTYFFTAP